MEPTYEPKSRAARAGSTRASRRDHRGAAAVAACLSLFAGAGAASAEVSNGARRDAAGERLPVPVAPAAAAVVAPPVDPDWYPLDIVPRIVPPRGRLRCPDVELVVYRGDVLRYHHPVRIYAGFRERLRRFEEVVRDVAIEIYGRAPRRIVHIGAFNCRRIRGYPDVLSEHALGNGIDIAGFDFGRLPRGEQLPEGLPRAIAHPFRVRMKDHWDGGRRAADEVHQRFLHTLAERLIARPDIFRVLLGPAWPGHRNHFHFDVAPDRGVAIFEPVVGGTDAQGSQKATAP